MIDLYALTSPNVQKIFIMLEECQLPYNTKIVDVWKGDQFSPEFSKINPLHKVPAIVDSDGPAAKPYTVIESGAILLYLAEKTRKFLPADPVKRFDTLQWLIVQVANLGPMSGQLVHFSKYAPSGQDYGASRYSTQVNKLYDLYEQRLATQAYVGCDEYTIADIAAFPGCAISSCLRLICRSVRTSRPGSTRLPPATASSAPWPRSPPSNRRATAPATTPRTSSSAAANTPSHKRTSHDHRNRTDRREARHGKRLRGRREERRAAVQARQGLQGRGAAALAREAGALPAVRAIGDAGKPHRRFPRLSGFSGMA